jgi:predicted amidohydrolase YtcJ
MIHPADLIITNARAITLDPQRPQAEALAVSGRRIAFVGSAAEAAGLHGPRTRVIDARGRTLLPGIIDSHYHLLWGALKLDDIRFEGVGSYVEMTTVVREYAAAHPNKPWLIGYGLGYAMLPDQAALTRQHLDAIVADRPLVVVAFDLHTAWANTRALQLAKLLHGGVCEPGNQIVMYDDGTASGELREPGAYNQVLELAPKPDEAQSRALLHKGLAQAAHYGITSIHNMDGDARQMARYAELEDRGELTLRVYIPYLVTPETPPAALAEAVAMRGMQTDMVRSGCVKFFMDGVVESYTALMLDDYADSVGNRGTSIFSAEQFTDLATEADRLGLQIAVHAIGDGAVRRTLDGFAHAQRANGQRAQGAPRRHRIEHIEVLHLDDLPRFKQLGVIASMQPLHAAVSAPGQVWAQRVGVERWGRSFPWQTLRESGAHLVFGSDWPVVTQNPFLGMQAALARQPWADGQPLQAQTLEATLAAYTRDAAYVEFQEGIKGQLCAGMLADLVLLSGDLETTPTEALAEMTVALTICDGRIVYEGE